MSYYYGGNHCASMPGEVKYLCFMKNKCTYFSLELFWLSVCLMTYMILKIDVW